MTELFENISQELKDHAEFIWTLVLAQDTPIEAAEFLNTVMNHYKTIYTEEEVEFLQFYFQMKMMEMNKDD